MWLELFLKYVIKFLDGNEAYDDFFLYQFLQTQRIGHHLTPCLVKVVNM